MASGNEMIFALMNEYNILLDKIENFSLKYPDNKDGYNYLIDYAQEKLIMAQGLGVTALPPLPKKK
jgi:hypothetical protein